jgi:N-acyl-D-aspartate/D-glutamate deacylase
MSDLVVRNGLLADGTGAGLRHADIAVEDGVITDVGTDLPRGRREIDAEGLLVTPGFVDPHTHYDGQATWDSVLAPSSYHGVTSAVMGNCGVGFAPVQPDRHDWLIAMMEGVEDIPGTALTEGLRWDWQSFPEYLDSLGRQERTLDVGTHVPHAALRAFVMGERGADPAAVPSADELSRMSTLVSQGLDAGAIGVSTSRTELHRTSEGDNLGTLRAEQAELTALASPLRDRGHGVFQLLSDAYRTNDDDFARRELDLIGHIARTAGRPVSFTVQQSNDAPQRWRQLMARAESLTASGWDVKAQVAPRPIGVILGLQTTSNPFTPCRAYARIARLPLAERVAAMRDPERRQRIIASHADLTGGDGAFAGMAFFGRFDDMYVLDDPVDYDLDAGRSLGATARAAGVAPAEYAYDLLLAREGRQLIYSPFFNFSAGNLDAVREMITSPAAMFGLSDAGAHCGTICDASMTTSYLSVWGRDRQGPSGIALENVVHQMTQRTAAHVGWLDRGVVAPGYLADLNVIDLGGLGCHPPVVVTDLPAGGRRLVQQATGYHWTVKRGTVTFDHGEPTGALPGALVRGSRLAPGGPRSSSGTLPTGGPR